MSEKEKGLCVACVFNGSEIIIISSSSYSSQMELNQCFPCTRTSLETNIFEYISDCTANISTPLFLAFTGCDLFLMI